MPADPCSHSSAISRSRSSGSHSISRENIVIVELQAKMKLQGIFPPITTPFDSNGDIYPAKVQHNVEKWNRTALSGYVVMGSTGESVMLTSEEKAMLWGMVANYAAPDKLLIAGTGVESVRETVSLTN